MRFRRYYRRHKCRLLQKKRERYWSDETYREGLKIRACIRRALDRFFFKIHK